MCMALLHFSLLRNCNSKLTAVVCHLVKLVVTAAPISEHHIAKHAASHASRTQLDLWPNPQRTEYQFCVLSSSALQC